MTKFECCNGLNGRVPQNGHAHALVSSQNPPTLKVIPPPRPGENGHGLDPAVAGMTVKLPTRVEWDNESTGVYVDDDEEALLMTAQDGVSI